MEETIP